MARASIASVVALVVLVAVLASTDGPAGALCIGPELAVPKGEVGRGTTLRVTGRGLGDACYDTGAPPDGEGGLGHPLVDVEVHVVQGEVRRLVASGNADERYELAVELTLPAELQPGPAALELDGPAGLADAPAVPIQVAATEAVAPTGPEVARFGPSEPAAAAPSTRPVDDGYQHPERGWLVVAPLLLALGLGLLGWLAYRHLRLVRLGLPGGPTRRDPEDPAP